MSTRRELTAIAAILLVQLSLLVYLAWHTGVTVDEPSHLLSSYLYWHGADNLKPGDMPPLIKIAGGWVPSLLGLPIPYDTPAWTARDEWMLALIMMDRMKGDQIQTTFFLARLTLVIFPLLCTVVLWRWARQLFSPWTGVLVAFVFSFSPSILGHGALFKNDLAATFGYLLFWYSAWKFWRTPSLANVACVAVALLVAILAKLSMLVLVLIAPILLAARFLSMRPIPIRKAALALLSLIAIVWFGVTAAWQFDARPLTTEELAYWQDPRVPQGLAVMAGLLGRLPAPPKLWTGVASLIHANADISAVYLLGQTYRGGHPLYFLVALALKVPVAQQVFIIGGFLLALYSLVRRRLVLADVFWLAPGAVYLVLASVSGLQLGLRLVLPALVFLVLLTGLTFEWCRTRRVGQVLVVLMVAWLMGKDMQHFPHYISYFNVWAGGPENGIRYLSDSNLDWGQDLRELAGIVRNSGLSNVHLSYFGTDNPYAYLPYPRFETLPPPWTDQMAKGTRLKPEPGYYAISATLLTGQFFLPKYRDYYDEFRHMAPIARAGYSIYLYRVP